MLQCWWRDRFLWLIWLLVLNFPVVQSLRSSNSGKDLLVRDSVNTLLQASLMPACTTTFITDGSNFSARILEAFHALNATHSVAFMETEPSKQSNLLVSKLTTVVQHSLKIKRTSSCLTIVLASDDIDFLINFIRISFDSGLSVHNTQLLLLTRMASDSLQLVQEQLSIINAAVVSLKELEIHQRYGVYVFLPYSRKRRQVAFWTSRYGLTYFDKETLFPNKNKRLQEGGHLTIAAIYYPPHAVLKVSTAQDGSSTATVTGPIMEVVKMLSTSINFTYDLVPFISYGYLLPNGSWNGLVGAVYSKEADIALGPLAITYERAKVVQYTVPIFVDYLYILARRGDTEIDPWSFVMPFNKEVWASLFASLALALIVSSVFAKIAFGYALPKSSLFAYYRILVQQDTDDEKLPWWERMIFGGWLLTVLISVESYSGNLMSLLAVRYISQPYQSLRNVLDDPRIKIMWMSNTVYEQYLKSSESGILFEVAKSEEVGKITYVRSSSSEYMPAVQNLVGKGTHVSVVPYFAQKVFLTKAFTDKGNCRFYLSREKYLPFTFAMVTQKNSPLLQSINDGLRGIVEGGLYNYWLEKAVPLAQGCNNPPTKFTVKSSLTVPELGGMFVTLLAGYAVGLTVFCLEVLSVKASYFLNDIKFMHSGGK